MPPILDGTRFADALVVFIELAVIWLVVYAVFRFLRGTRGAGVLKGVIVVLAAIILSLRFAGGGSDSFVRLRFVAEALAGTLALALVVIFQPELRQALVRLGQSRWLAGRDTRFSETAPAIEEAVEFLSRNQFGALIVIERSVPLGDAVRTGVALDSAVSARLLEAIFWPNSPLHDLAVVVSGDRLVAANVQLPLADPENVPPRLGSRHLAAVGITEETDAIVVVVSEQTGAVRIAAGGRLGEPVPVEGFAEELRRAITAEEPVPAAGEGKSA